MLEIKSNSSPKFSFKLVIIALVLLTLTLPLSVQADSPPAPNGDLVLPIQFCPKGKAYEDPNCSEKRQYMYEAITDAYNAAISGTIYVESGSYAGNGSGDWILISGFDLGTSLTIQGGVGGGITTFTRQLRLDSNTDLDFTVKDVTIETTTYTEHGIYVYNNTGNYLFENVAVNDSLYEGIYINSHTGDVTLQSVQVDNSAQFSIDILDIEGNVALNQINATNSQNSLGVHLGDIRGKKGVKLTDVESNGNYATNIYIFAITGDATLVNCEASGSVNGSGVDISIVHGKKGVIIENTDAGTNDNTNFYIHDIDNAVTMENVTANDSVTGAGIYMKNIRGKKGASFKTVTASGNQTFNMWLENFENGAALSDINANNGLGEGIYANNIRGTKGVSISDANANTNNGNNIRIIDVPYGSVTLTNVFANESATYHGIDLEEIGGKKGVKLNNVVAGANYGYNLYVKSITGDFSFKTGECSDSINYSGIYLYMIGGKKGVSISGVEASNNEETNISMSTITGNVSLSDVIAHNSTYNRGIDIINVNGPKGVTFKGVAANENNDTNINLHNILGNAALRDISAQNSANEEGIVITILAGLKGITLSSANTSGNKKDGMYFYDITGNIQMKDVESSNSTSGRGMYLYVIHGSKGISLANITALDNQNTNVLANDVDGNVSLKAITASNSDSSYGVRLINIYGLKGITMSDVTAEGNEDGNVVLYTISGGVSLKNIVANGSVSSSGLDLESIFGPKGVKGSSITASTNGNFNIYIGDITGDVTLSGVTATGAGTYGGYISNVYGYKGLMIKTADFSGSSSTNLEIHSVSPGYAVLSNVNASSSINSTGLYVQSVNGILMIMNSIFNNNDITGIEVSAQNGQISLKNVVANENATGSGAYLESNANQLVCSSTFKNNTVFGLYADTHMYSLTTSQLTFDLNGTDISYTGAYEDSPKCKVIPAP